MLLFGKVYPDCSLEGKVARGPKLTTHLHLVSRSRLMKVDDWGIVLQAGSSPDELDFFQFT
jgi:hypothetical protein